MTAGHDAMGSMDHGVKYHALWLWKGGALDHGMFVEAPDSRGAAFAVGAQVRGWLRAAYGNVSTQLGVLVVEKPEVRQLQGQRGRQTDIVDLAISVGMVQVEVRPLRVLDPTPSQWSKGKKKPPRHKATLAVLTQAERDVVDSVLSGVSAEYKEDMLDGLALGAWALRRVEW